MMLFTLIFGLLLLVGIAFVVAWLVSRYRGPGESPLDILKRRYAQGEISREEYERMRQELSQR